MAERSFEVIEDKCNLGNIAEECPVDENKKLEASGSLAGLTMGTLRRLRTLAEAIIVEAGDDSLKIADQSATYGLVPGAVPDQFPSPVLFDPEAY